MEEFLQKIILFKDLNQWEIEQIAKKAFKKSCDKKDVIFLEGSFGDTIYFILTGLVKIFKTNEDGREKTLALLGEKEFFGEMALLDSHNRSASATAVNQSKLIVLKKQEFNNLVLEHPEIALKIIAILSNRLRKANGQIERLAFNDVESRLIGVLNTLKADYGVKKEEGILISKQLTHQELANLVGTTRGTVTKLLNKMADKEQLINKRGYILLKAEKFQ